MKLCFFFSEVNDTRDNTPQNAHLDLADEVTQFEESKIGVKSCIAFIPINPDGMIILVWRWKERKNRTLDAMNQDCSRH